MRYALYSAYCTAFLICDSVGIFLTTTPHIIRLEFFVHIHMANWQAHLASHIDDT
jgi:hypothetical protein